VAFGNDCDGGVFDFVDMRIGDKRAEFWEQGLASARILRLLYAASAVR
jgi:hypothetical protein